MTDWTAEAANWYAEKYGEHPTNSLTIEALELKPDASIVDVGCGTGSALRHAATRVTDGSLIGIDPVPRMIEIAKGRAATHPRGDRIEFREGHAEKLPINTNSAGIVLALDSFNHWQDQQQGLAEIKRILHHDGQLVIVKDGGVPSRSRTPQTLTLDEHLQQANIQILNRRRIEASNVWFTMWLCAQRLDPSGTTP